MCPTQTKRIIFHASNARGSTDPSTGVHAKHCKAVEGRTPRRRALVPNSGTPTVRSLEAIDYKAAWCESAWLGLYRVQSLGRKTKEKQLTCIQTRTRHRGGALSGSRVVGGSVGDPSSQDTPDVERWTEPDLSRLGVLLVASRLHLGRKSGAISFWQTELLRWLIGQKGANAFQLHLQCHQIYLHQKETVKCNTNHTKRLQNPPRCSNPNCLVG